MKRVLLRSLSMRNFRGEQERTTTFNEKETWICGRNGLGKSRHFDATIWLLFGKDSCDRKDYEIKTRINGEELHKVETSVTGVFDVDGETITLKRAIVENWVKPHGKTEQEFRGNVTECWYNETPVSVTEYAKRVDAIIDATLFKMITNPEFFVSMNWKDQREQLMKMAGDITDESIVAGHPEFVALMNSISGKSLADFRKELAAKRKRLQNELAEIQPRIDQTQKMLPESVNVDELKDAIAKCDADIAECDKMIADASAAVRAAYEAAQEREKEIGKLKVKQQEIINAAKIQAQDDATKANAERVNTESELRTMNSEFSSKNIEVKRINAEIDADKEQIEKCNNQRENLLREWEKVNGEQYAGDDVCPHCHQPLPQEMRETALNEFNNRKSGMLAEISKQGKKNNEIKEGFEKSLADKETKLAGLEKDIADLDARIKEKQQWIIEHPSVKPVEVNAQDIPAWVELQDKIDAIKNVKIEEKPQTDELSEKKRGLNAKRDELRAELAKDDQRKKGLEEIERLEKSGKSLAQQIADIEKEQFMADEFVRVRVTECERRINAMFTMVQFRMFDYTQEGNAVETCIAMVNGVPYPVANSASQVNAGLDIINALCRYYETSAPIFIDNAESVNEHIQTESQIINLVVSNDNELIIK